MNAAGVPRIQLLLIEGQSPIRPALWQNRPKRRPVLVAIGSDVVTSRGTPSG